MSKKNNNMDIAKSIGTGLMAGMMVGFASAKMMNNSKSIKNKTDRTMRTMGELVDNVQSFFK